MCLNLKMPGRKKTAVLPLFKDVVGGDFKTPRVKCIFAVQLWPRMENHIKKCVKCTDDIRHKYVRFSKEKETTAASSGSLMIQASSNLWRLRNDNKYDIL